MAAMLLTLYWYRELEEWVRNMDDLNREKDTVGAYIGVYLVASLFGGLLLVLIVVMGIWMTGDIVVSAVVGTIIGTYGFYHTQKKLRAKIEENKRNN